MFKAAKTNLSGAVDEVESIDSDELLIDLPKKRGRPSWIGRLRRNLGGHRSVFRLVMVLFVETLRFPVFFEQLKCLFLRISHDNDADYSGSRI